MLKRYSRTRLSYSRTRLPYSRTRLALFPNSFVLIPELLSLIPELVWSYSCTRTRLGSILEASWAGKVANMAPTWPQVGSQVGAKMYKKIHPKIDQKIDGSWASFGRIFAGFWEGK